jgi:hypothetical protein
MNDKLFVINGQRKCPGWKNSSLNDSCEDICNYTSIWSALAYKQITKLYTTYESPWYFMLHLLPEETVCLRKNFLFRKKDFLSFYKIERCDRKRKYYDLNKCMANRFFLKELFYRKVFR